MHEEQDTCRICSAPAEPDQPLFYPCKCSGTIRYIHQDCLTTWLAHSKKKTCDVCKYPYSFTKVYSPDMPASLPFVLLLRRLAQQGALGILFVLRAVMVGSIWLAFLPWSTIWTWRIYFALGDSLAWWISSRPRPEPPEFLVPTNTTASPGNTTTPAGSVNATLLTAFLTHPTVRSISADIVSGQIIASLIVLGFVAVFLLREWISQNARPGVFDEADAPADDQEQPLQAQVVRPPPQLDDEDDEDALPVEPGDLIFVNPQEPPRALPLADNAARPNGGLAADELGFPWKPYHAEDDDDTAADTEDGITGDETSVPDPSESGASQASGLRRRHSWGDTFGPSPGGSPSSSIHSEQTHSGFRAPSPLAGSPEFSVGRSTALDSPPPYQFDNMPPPSASMAEKIRWLDEAMPRVRPALPNSNIPESLTSSPATSRVQTPSGSPSLATYRAPEELEGGPSDLMRYQHDAVDRGIQANEDPDMTREEHDRYFREPTEKETDEETEDEDAAMEGVARRRQNMPPPQWSDEDPEEEEEDDGPFGEEPDEDRPEEVEAPANGPRDQQQPREEIEALEAEEEINLEDDMDGALEAIGLRGPIYGVLQNAVLMIFVLDTTIGILIFLPFAIGKSVALLALDPRRFLQVLHWPIRAIRFVTDPVVDLALYLIARTVVPPLSRMSQLALGSLAGAASCFFGEDLANKGFDVGSIFLNRTLEAMTVALDRGVVFLTTAPETPTIPTPSLLERMAANDTAFFQIAEPYFAPIGNAVRLGSRDFQSTWLRLAVGNGTSERMFAIALGYTIDAILVALYLNVLTVGSVRSAGRAFRNAVRQQLLVVKVAAFIIVELVVFPLGCGIMLDICTVWLFPMGSFRSRATFLVFAPLTSGFYHWVVGTMFMYQFAILLAGCRSIMRPGAMWFIKDPQDQNFHPIRDILERPTFVQIRKLLLSAVMYGLVVACGVATVSGILRVFSRTIMPFRWKIREPLSIVPVDLLFMHIVLPYTMHYFRPKRLLHRIGVQLWKYLAHQLRLTSYMFGDRYVSEEYTPKHWQWRQLFMARGIDMGDSEAEHDGTFRRVPSSDNVALVKNQRATVQVDENGEPATPEDARLMDLQDQEATKAKRNIKDDYTIVYLPPHFRYRITLFILGLWIVGSVMLASSIAAPILVGRGFFKLFVPRHVHDGYSFFAGFFLLWACWIVGQTVDRMDKRRQRRGGDEPRAQLPLYIAKRSLLWAAQMSYLAFFLGFVIPTLVATTMELYVIMPVRYTLNPEMNLRIRVVDMWALGLLYAKIGLRAHRLQPESAIARGIEHIQRTGWTHPDPFRATKEVIAPLTAGLLGMILLPPALLWVIRVAFALPMSENFLFMHVYPTIFTVAGCTHGLISVSTLIGAWSQGIRDKEFLVEMRLQNLESEPTKTEAMSETVVPIEAKGNGDRDAAD